MLLANLVETHGFKALNTSRTTDVHSDCVGVAGPPAAEPFMSAERYVICSNTVAKQHVQIW
jgi:hypothetical protein